MNPCTLQHRVSFHTLGCKLNFAESSTFARMLTDKGWVRAQAGEEPDLCLVNTCSVTEAADKKGRQLIRMLHRRHPGARIVVTGCYAQLKPAEVAELPGVSLVLGQAQKAEMILFIEKMMAGEKQGAVQVDDFKSIRTFVPACGRGERTRFWLKVQDGCDYWCSYCTIPAARGRSRSGTIESMVRQAREAAAEGGKEIVITGVNIGDFGKGTDENFLDLCRALDGVDGIERYRISSIEPNLLTDELIDFVASSRRFMPHFHVPLQSGDDEVLQLMRRHYDTALFRHKMERIKSAMPHAFIGVDLIVGARGETEERFMRSKAFVESLPVSRLHVFTYSERPGTRALEIQPVVSAEEKHRRTRIMLGVSDRLYGAFAGRFAGTVRPVLLEHPKSGRMMSGFTDNYLRVEVEASPSLDNRIVDVRLGTPDVASEIFKDCTLL